MPVADTLIARQLVNWGRTHPLKLSGVVAESTMRNARDTRSFVTTKIGLFSLDKKTNLAFDIVTKRM